MSDERLPSTVLDDEWIIASCMVDYETIEPSLNTEIVDDPSNTWIRLDDGRIVTESEWMYGDYEGGGVGVAGPNPPIHTGPGKWMLFVSLDNLDSTWEQVKLLTRKGKLGPISKVSTMNPSRNASNPDGKVIIIYAVESMNFNEVSRIVWVLHRENLISKYPIYYKEDRATQESKYSLSGQKVSIYELSKEEFESINYRRFLDYFEDKYGLK